MATTTATMATTTMATATIAATAVETSTPKHLDLHGNVFEVPDFTMKQIYDAIPPHCFRPSTIRSMAYVVRDYIYLGSLIYLTHLGTPLLPHASLRFLAYTAYTIAGGIIMTGIWILAHECGHGAFSKSKRLNNVMGLILHSFLLVPYHSWRLTHSQHHKATGNLERDVVFIPHSRESWIKRNFGKDADPRSVTLSHLAEDAPIVSLWWCVVHQLFGWPGYLFSNLTGQTYAKGFPQHSHFWFGLDSTFFKEADLSLILLSDMGCIAMVGLLSVIVRTYGWWAMIVYWGIPYLWVNNWIVAITFLQHTDGTLPHYAHSQWNFARGAAATIDRDFGIIDTHFFHDIIGTHVCHHLVSSIPFYHAGEATIAIRKVMGKHYRADTKTNFIAAFWKNQRECKFVEESSDMDGTGVFLYRNLHGKGTAPRNLAAGEKCTTWPSAMKAQKSMQQPNILSSLPSN
ncbi:MAG: hypothetical protein M1834_007099 [Cirrosporium novae-zelandiae]|nr:MAG: hypothetical protein M1834_007099 [Cirrosporium novae-zelandiae]